MFGDSFFVGNTVELAVVRAPKRGWLSLLGASTTTALLAYKGEIGRDAALRFVVKESSGPSARYDVFSEEGATDLHLALQKYQVALEKFQRTGAADNGAELGGFQEQGHGVGTDKWTAKIARHRTTLGFVVKRSRGVFPLAWSSETIEYSAEEAEILQSALRKYQTALEKLRSTGTL